MKKDKYEIIMGMDSINETNSKFLPTPSYRNMLDNIHLKCYVESESTGQYGTVVKIIKNRFKVPVCVQVSYQTDADDKLHYDYISVDRISLYEPYSNYVPDDEYYDDEYYNKDKL